MEMPAPSHTPAVAMPVSDLRSSAPRGGLRRFQAGDRGIAGPMRRRLLALLVAFAFALAPVALAGCGQGDDGGRDSPAENGGNGEDDGGGENGGDENGGY